MLGEPIAVAKRMRHNQKLLAQLGFSQSATIALNDRTPELHEEISARLIQELLRVRNETKKNNAPVRRGTSISELFIADLTCSMLESYVPPGLLALHIELTNVRRHRDQLARVKHSEWHHAASTEGQLKAFGKTISVRKLADAVGVDLATIVRWRKEPDYKDYVAWVKADREKDVAAGR